MDWFRAECNRTWRAAHDSGPRRARDILWVVIHSTETAPGTAEAVARYFASPSSTASTHLVIDDSSCFRTVPDLIIPWGAPGANTNGFHVELVGRAAWTTPEWMRHEQTLDAAAFKTALRCHWYGIPPRWVGPTGLRLKRRGITTHHDCSRAFKTSGGHWDPGPGFPRDTFLNHVKQHLAEFTARKET